MVCIIIAIHSHSTYHVTHFDGPIILTLRVLGPTSVKLSCASTMSYILAPSLVPPRICTKASALMALTYQVAHILGLMIAIALALALYGNIAGGL